ncbi:MAG: hypothetical protein JWO52_5109, partial [Gammaproteobacteria bacterium]|nr:hypothetical protein [Gammaproteobacteria bacterium]
MSSERDAQRSLYLGRRAFLTALGLAVAGIGASTEAETPLAGDPSATGFVDSLPLYVPDGRVSGRICLWGHGSFKHDFLGKLLHAWIDGFQRHQPEVQ